MGLAKREDASFRDPSGHVYLLGDRVLRSVSEAAAAVVETCRVENAGAIIPH